LRPLITTVHRPIDNENAFYRPNYRKALTKLIVVVVVVVVLGHSIVNKHRQKSGFGQGLIFRAYIQAEMRA